MQSTQKYPVTHCGHLCEGDATLLDASNMPNNVKQLIAVKGSYKAF